MTTNSRVGPVLAVVMMILGAWPGSASAQVFGTFSWQMQPYCNVVTLTITQIPGGYTIDGNDNQCGAAQLAGAAGMALINPDGTVGLEFTIVTAPAGKALHVSASLDPGTGSGPWTDSVSNSGTLALGATGAGPARPFPVSGLGASVITTTEIANGAVGGADINPAEVQARVSGTCPAGQAVSGVNADGTVVCASALGTEVQFRAINQSPQVIASGGNQTVLFSTTLENTGGGVYVPATGVYTVPLSGLYHLSYVIVWQIAPGSLGRRCVFLSVPGEGAAGANCGAPTTTTTTYINGSAVVRLSAGSTVSVQVTQTSGGADAIPAATATGFSVTRLR